MVTYMRADKDRGEVSAKEDKQRGSRTAASSGPRATWDDGAVEEPVPTKMFDGKLEGEDWGRQGTQISGPRAVLEQQPAVPFDFREATPVAFVPLPPVSFDLDHDIDPGEFDGLRETSSPGIRTVPSSTAHTPVSDPAKPPPPADPEPDVDDDEFDEYEDTVALPSADADEFLRDLSEHPVDVALEGDPDPAAKAPRSGMLSRFIDQLRDSGPESESTADDAPEAPSDPEPTAAESPKCDIDRLLESYLNDGEISARDASMEALLADYLVGGRPAPALPDVPVKDPRKRRR